jgi:uncharacterized membrane protein YdjX (TVP38/TMEM64 family)
MTVAARALAGRGFGGYGAAAAALGALMLALFGLVQLLDVPVLAEESPRLGAGAGIGAAAASFALLVGDVVLPVPSSGVMIANGALFGWPAATVLSLAGCVGAGLFGGALGRRGGPLLRRRLDPGSHARLQAALARRGTLVVIVTRPVPIVAETTAILAGAMGMSNTRLGVASAIGSLPPALAYALAGAVAGGYGDPVLVFGGVLAASAAVWLADVGRRRPRTAVRP